MADSIPIVVICGQVPTAAIGSDAFQEAPVTAIMGSVAKHVFLVTDPLRLEATMRTAFEIARTGRPGPVVVDVPKDVQNWQGTFLGENQLPIPGYRQRLADVESNALTDASCQQFFSMLGESRRPLIYAGGGVVNANASAALRAFAGAFKIPVASTLMGLGGFDTKHPLSLHMLGMHGTASANYAVDDCDLLIAIGARFDDRVAGVPAKFAPKAKRILHFDIDPSEIHKVKKADWHHVGLLPAALDALVAYGRRTGFAPNSMHGTSKIAALKATYGLNYDRDSPLVQPQYVMETMNRITQGEAIITSGVGQHQMWAAQYCDFREPRLWLTSGSMGTMGFGLPAAIGAQIANPGKLVIDVDGDASIRMNLGELETVTTYDLPIKIVVLNNFGDGMVMQWQRLFFKGRLSASDKSLRKKDFVKTAQADGFGFAKRIDAKHDVPRVLEEFLSFAWPGVPRGHHRPDGGRVSDGRPGLVVPRDDHGRLHSESIRVARQGADAGQVGNVLKVALYETTGISILFGAAIAIGAAPVAAHHSFAIYDMAQNVEFRGVIDTVKLRNPHMAMTLTVTDEDGQQKTINFVEGAPANMLARLGLRPEHDSRWGKRSRRSAHHVMTTPTPGS